MNRSILTGLLIGAVVVTAGSVIAGLSTLRKQQANEPAFAKVLHVEAVRRIVQTPREICEDIPVIRQQPLKDKSKSNATVTSTSFGGVLENQLGDGSALQRISLAEVAALDHAGNPLQARHTYTTTERNCYIVKDTNEVVDSYDVSYRLGQIEGKVRMGQDPGSIIPVANGQLVVTLP